ncbi:MAG TPA: hypothetical protein PKV15_09865 [Syntrophomonadaceae bacterium]|jgi:hypothetical protein|nr:hypothetical protein [Syntrophomonadaceae bacterium]HRX21870.1 hypothetical protein [Syntrophomonadaceae bacterium]
MQLSTRELLYLEDCSKMMEAIQKTCQHAMSECTDPQVKSLIQKMGSEHNQLIQSSASFVSRSSMQ